MPRGNVRDQVERTNGYVPDYAPEPADGGAVLAIREDQPYWTETQVAALSSLGIRDATPGDLQVFMHYCLRTGLDPFARQIYLIKRRSWNKETKGYDVRQTIQVGIDGFRVIRDRIAKERGVIVEYDEDGTTFYDEAGTEFDVWLKDDEPPVAGKFRVYVIIPARDGQPERRLPFTAKARFNSYADRKHTDDGTLGELLGQWKTRGDYMLGKCLEALALRMAFPNDLSGVYTEEELARDAVADGPPEGYRPDPPARGTVRSAIPGRVERSAGTGGRRHRARPDDPATPEPPAEKRTSETVAALFDRIGVAKTEDRVRAVVAILGPDYRPGKKLSPEQETEVVAKLQECIDGATDAADGADPDDPEVEIRTPLDCLNVIVAAAESSDSPKTSPSEPAD
jgi:phage recombination protein Bet